MSEQLPGTLNATQAEFDVLQQQHESELNRQRDEQLAYDEQNFRLEQEEARQKFDERQRAQQVAGADARQQELNAKSEHLRELNDAAELRIFGSGSHTYHDPKTGAVIASPDKPMIGKIEEMRRNPRYKHAGAETYKDMITSLTDNGFELAQAELIANRTLGSQDRIARLTANYIKLGDNPKDAHHKAAELLKAENHEFASTLRNEGIMSIEQYAEHYGKQPPKVVLHQEQERTDKQIAQNDLIASELKANEERFSEMTKRLITQGKSGEDAAAIAKGNIDKRNKQFEQIVRDNGITTREEYRQFMDAKKPVRTPKVETTPPTPEPEPETPTGPTEPETPPEPEQPEPEPEPEPTRPKAPEPPEGWDDLDEPPQPRDPDQIPRPVVPASAEPDADPGIYKNINQPEHPTPQERRGTLAGTIGNATWKWLRGHDEHGNTTRVGGVGKAIKDAVRQYNEDKGKTPKQAEQAAETVAAMITTVMGETVEPVQGSDEAFDYTQLSKDDLRRVNLKSLSSEDFAAAQSAMDLKGVLPTRVQQKEMNRRARIERQEANRQEKLARKARKNQPAEQNQPPEPIAEATPVNPEENEFDNYSFAQLNQVQTSSLSPDQLDKYIAAVERAKDEGLEPTGYMLAEIAGRQMDFTRDPEVLETLYQKAMANAELDNEDKDWLTERHQRNVQRIQRPPLGSDWWPNEGQEAGTPASKGTEREATTAERTLTDDLLGESTTPVADTPPETYIPLPSERMKMSPKEYGEFVESLSDDGLARLFNNVQSLLEFKDLQELTQNRLNSAPPNSLLDAAYQNARDYFTARDYFVGESDEQK